MTLHHIKHHEGYTNALNAAEEKYLQVATPKERVALQAAIKLIGGGKSRIKLLIPHRMRDNTVRSPLDFRHHYTRYRD